MSEARDTQVIAESRRVSERLARLGWYHSIELPDGSVIEGLQSVERLRRRIGQFPVPADLTGKRVLDIGAWDGWFSFEMEKRGAQVLAVDSTRNTRLLEARKLLGSRIDYHIGDICRLTSKDIGTFDIVLFFGVLYHLKHPLLALENVCGMCRDMACIESFVTDADLNAIPSMEFYETTELRGQLDNWVGPNVACLMAMSRTAGFARVDFQSTLAERAHVTGYRQWPAAASGGPAPVILCVANSTTHDHTFSAWADDYVTFYFTAAETDLTCDNVYPRIGPYGSRPMYVANTGGGWQATCKIPPGLEAGWHDATLRVADSGPSGPLRIGVDIPPERRTDWTVQADADFHLASIADGRTFESGRVRVGTDTAITAWAQGLRDFGGIRIRLNGTDLPAIWHDPSTGQINAVLPAGLEPGRGRVSLVSGDRETQPLEIELYRS
jgi:tRNA (mo5U34)-methyltransferase